MMKLSTVLAVLLCFIVSKTVLSQTINPAILSSKWNAQWVSVPTEPAKDYGVYHFRKSFELLNKPSSFIIHVSLYPLKPVVYLYGRVKGIY